MKIEKLNKAKIPLVKINNELERFKDKNLFKDKLDLANNLFKNAVLPKISN